MAGTERLSCQQTEKQTDDHSYEDTILILVVAGKLYDYVGFTLSCRYLRLLTVVECGVIVAQAAKNSQIIMTAMLKHEINTPLVPLVPK